LKIKEVQMKQAADSTVQAESQIVLDAIRKMVRSLREASKQAEKTLGLSAAQLFVLNKLAESDKPLSINDLAQKTLTHQSSVSVVVTKLVKQNLVVRMTSPTDKRAVALQLSTKGEEVIRGAPQVIQQRLVEGISSLTPQERHGLVKGLQALIEKSGLQKEEPALFFED
jgi:DNA-binding MarR family transcriptional regulator